MNQYATYLFQIILFGALILNLNCQEKNNTKVAKDYTTSWRQYLGNNNTGYYDDNFVLPKTPQEVFTFQHKDGTTSPLIVDKGTVYFGTYKSSFTKEPTNYIYAIDSLGQQQWRRPIKGHISHSLAIHNDILIVAPTDNDSVYGLNAEDGNILWKTKYLYPGYSNDFLWRYSAPVIHNNVVYINAIMALDITTGQPITRYKTTKKWPPLTQPTFKDSIMYTSFDQSIYAFNKHNLELLWSIDGLYRANTKVFLYKDSIYAGQESVGLKSYSLKTHLTSGDSWFDANTRKDYGVQQDSIYYFSADQSTWGARAEAYNLKTRKRVWYYNALGGRNTSEPIIIGDYMYLAINEGAVNPRGYIHVIHKNTGEDYTIIPVGYSTTGSVVYANGKIYVATEDSFYGSHVICFQ